MQLFASSRRVLLLTLAVATLVMLRLLLLDIDDLRAGRFSNPDVYYRLALVEGFEQGHALHHQPRDNAPHGVWIHWSAPYGIALWLAHKPLVWAGLATKPALWWAGAGLTMASMLALVAFTVLAVLRAGARKAAPVAALTLLASPSLYGYGQPSQITHHVFMLVPVAAAAWCLMGRLHGTGPRADLLAGALLALALWISPETMPLVSIVAATRGAMALQRGVPSHSAVLGAALLAGTALALWLDPPPPTFGIWALDHVSLAWLWFAALVAAWLWIADRLALRPWLPSRRVAVAALAGAALATLWLLGTPGALAGPAGLLPDELRQTWWPRINELEAADTAQKRIFYAAMPVLGGLAALVQAARQRQLWLAALGAAAIAYGWLGASHLRMGAAGALVAALAYGLALARWAPLEAGEHAAIPLRQQLLGLLLVWLPLLVLGTGLLMGRLATEAENANTTAASINATAVCHIGDIRHELERLPPSVVLVGTNEASALLFWTRHQTIAGNYHHNVQGLLDVTRAWNDRAPWERLHEVLWRRQVGYVLFCTPGDDVVPDRVTTHTAHHLATGQTIAGLRRMEPPTPAMPSAARWHLFEVRLDAPVTPDSYTR